MKRKSAGLLMYRFRDNQLQVLLAHPGGPYFTKKDEGVWTIPKGELEEEEELFAAAVREFQEETGFVPRGPYTELSPVTQRSGKTVHAWAFEGDCDPATMKSNMFTMEWPPKSGRQSAFPEMDRADYFTANEAKRKIIDGQVGLIDELELILKRR
jgi:predicted NUDIX family NTP pyrophosphohydrolase